MSSELRYILLAAVILLIIGVLLVQIPGTNDAKQIILNKL